MKQHDLITALRARGRSDALAQAAADEIERLQGLAVPAPTPAQAPSGTFRTEKVKQPDGVIIRAASEFIRAAAEIGVKKAAKKAPAKTAGKAKR